MKTCPSCQNLIHDDLMLCPHCGYDFDSDASASKRTMMGIPGVNLQISPPKDGSVESAPPTRSTLFGIPLGDDIFEPEPEEGSLHDESTSSEDDSQTRVLAGDSLKNMPSLEVSPHISLTDQQEDIRSTSMGGFPSLGKNISNLVSEVSELSESSSAEDVSKTEVASASFIATLRESSEFRNLKSQTEEGDPLRVKRHETLVGMSLQDLAALESGESQEEGQVPESISRTLFSLPVVPRPSDMSEASSAEDEPKTQMMSPANTSHTVMGIPSGLGTPSEIEETLGGGPQVSIAPDDKKAALLAKLRKGRLRQDSEASEAVEAKEEPPRLAPKPRSTMFGVPSIAPPKADEAQTRPGKMLFDAPSDVEDESPAPATGVLRRQAFSGGHKKLDKDSALLGAPSYSLDSASAPSEHISIVSEVNLSEVSEDLPFAETAVMHGNEAKRTLDQIVPEIPDVPDVDATREQSISDLRAYLGDLEEDTASTAEHDPVATNEDATVQQDLSEIREHLSQELLRPDLPPEDTLPELEVEPHYDDLPMVDVEPLPVAPPVSAPLPSVDLIESAAPPPTTTPQRTAVMRDESVMMQRPVTENKLGRTFQIAFGAFASLALFGALGFHLATSFSTVWVSAAAGALGLGVLVGVFAPLKPSLRVVLLLVSGLLSLGLFGAGVALIVLEPGLLLICVGGLCAFAAAVFPKIAKSL